MSSKERPLIADRHLAEAREIAARFPSFLDGCRVILLKSRGKDGQDGQITHTARGMISNNREEWLVKIAMLLREREHLPELKLRIYQTINARNIDKAIRRFKERLIELEHEDAVRRHAYFLKPKAAMMSALMQPTSSATKYFLFDCDTQDQAVIDSLRTDLTGKTRIVHDYPTKNGCHVITQPFNPALVKLPPLVEMKKDALMLLHFDY